MYCNEYVEICWKEFKIIINYLLFIINIIIIIYYLLLFIIIIIIIIIIYYLLFIIIHFLSELPNFKYKWKNAWINYFNRLSD